MRDCDGGDQGLRRIRTLHKAFKKSMRWCGAGGRIYLGFSPRLEKEKNPLVTYRRNMEQGETIPPPPSQFCSKCHKI